MRTEDTPFGYGRRLRLPQGLRPELRVPLGKLVDDREFERMVKGLDSLVTVGDHCTMEALKASVEPKVAVVDFRIKREEDSRVRGHPFSSRAKVLVVVNEPAHISAEAWQTLSEALASPEEVLVQVQGEEDLLTLPAIVLAPDGFVVAYGLPDRGAVLVAVDSESKARVNQILSRMEVVNGG